MSFYEDILSTKQYQYFLPLFYEENILQIVFQSMIHLNKRVSI